MAPQRVNGRLPGSQRIAKFGCYSTICSIHRDRRTFFMGFSEPL